MNLSLTGLKAKLALRRMELAALERAWRINAEEAVKIATAHAQRSTEILQLEAQIAAASLPDTTP